MSDKKQYRINFFDVAIVAIVIVVAIVAVGMYMANQKKVVNKSTKMTYSLELIDNPVGFSNLIQEGDSIKDSEKNFNMGKIIGVEVTDYTRVLNDLENEIIVETIVPNRERVVLTVEADVVDTGSELLVDNQYAIRVGRDVYVKGPQYGGIGYIISIDRD